MAELRILLVENDRIRPLHKSVSDLKNPRVCDVMKLQFFLLRINHFWKIIWIATDFKGFQTRIWRGCSDQFRIWQIQGFVILVNVFDNELQDFQFIFFKIYLLHQ